MTGFEPCGRVLHHDTVGLLGIASQCTWLDPTRLEVYLGNLATVSIGDLLRVRPNTIKNTAGISSYSEAVGAVLAPLKAPKPTLIVTASSRFGVCQDVRIDTGASYGALAALLPLRREH
jgi:hypothetical protein